MPEAPVGFLSVEDYLRLPRDPETWLIKPLIPTSGAALLYGAPKLGKSGLAIQLAAALSGAYDDWLGFPIVKPGPVLYLQLDQPRSTWADRFEKLKAAGLKWTENLKLADRETIGCFPCDVLRPEHARILRELVQYHKAESVIVDTLRECHSGDENDSTVSRNVIANLVSITAPAALAVVSHDRKPSAELGKDLMADHRGSGYITGRMDCILRMTRNKLYYGGRSIEEGSIKLNRISLDGTVMFDVATVQEEELMLAKVMTDQTLPSARAKARALALLLHIPEETAMSRIRRAAPQFALSTEPVAVAS